MEETETPQKLNLQEVKCTTPEANHEIIPIIGMDFDSEDLAYEFYNQYGRTKGFSIRKDWVNKNKDGAVRSRNFTCCKEGHSMSKKQNNVKHPRKETRTGCKAHMTISYHLTSGKYHIKHFEDQHNHELVPPNKVQFLRSQRKINLAHGGYVDSAESSGTKPKETYDFMSRQVGGKDYVGFLHSGLKNYLSSRRKRHMNHGEAGNLLHYFQKKQYEDPTFIYAIQLDVDDRPTNIFWTDAKMVLDYHQFGDVVRFDTSSKIIRECRPFAPFIGVNNHKETVVFGAVLLYDETIESFKWIFEAFVEAMSGKKPKTIFTDQDSAMSNVIASILPETYHRICPWHLYQNALKHINHVFKASTSFAKDFKSCIYDYEEEEEFLYAWKVMLKKYDLCENEWLRGIFGEKEKWALVYGRDTFCADMKNTQLIENFNSILKKCLNPQLDIWDLFNHFERLLDDLRYKELKNDFDMTQRIPRLKVNSILLMQARDAYTANVFDWFQEEFEKSMNLVINSCMENGSSTVYKVSVYGMPQEHTVTSESLTNAITCSCRKFEFDGILCCHVLKVFERMNIKLIPTQYILKRWTKDAIANKMEKCRDKARVEDPKLAVLQRYKELCQNAVSLSALAAGSEENYDFLIRHLEEARTMLIKKRKNPSESFRQMPDLGSRESFNSLGVCFG